MIRTKRNFTALLDWLEKLSQYTQIRDERITKGRFAELTLMLSRKFPSGVFCYESMSLIAENRIFSLFLLSYVLILKVG